MGSEYGGGTQRHMRSTLRLAAHGLEELVQHREGHQDDHGRGRPRGLLQLFDDAAAEATGAVAAAGPSRAAGRARTERGRAGPALVRAAALAPTEPAAAAFAAAGAANPGALTALEPAAAVSSPRPDSVAATSLLPLTAWPT